MLQNGSILMLTRKYNGTRRPDGKYYEPHDTVRRSLHATVLSCAKIPRRGGMSLTWWLSNAVAQIWLVRADSFRGPYEFVFDRVCCGQPHPRSYIRVSARCKNARSHTKPATG